jgi:hypothetical protein
MRVHSSEEAQTSRGRHRACNAGLNDRQTEKRRFFRLHVVLEAAMDWGIFGQGSCVSVNVCELATISVTSDA